MLRSAQYDRGDYRAFATSQWNPIEQQIRQQHLRQVKRKSKMQVTRGGQVTNLLRQSKFRVTTNNCISSESESELRASTLLSWAVAVRMPSTLESNCSSMPLIGAAKSNSRVFNEATVVHRDIIHSPSSSRYMCWYSVNRDWNAAPTLNA